MEKTGSALPLVYVPTTEMHHGKGMVLDPCFTKEDVVNKMNEALTNPKYKARA